MSNKPFFESEITEAYSGLNYAYYEAQKICETQEDRTKLDDLYQQAYSSLENFEMFGKNAFDRTEKS